MNPHPDLEPGDWTMKLSDESKAAIELFLASIGEEFLMLPSMTRGEWSWLVILMKAAPDRAEWFPKGKWATIQHIENQLLSEARQIVGPAALGRSLELKSKEP